MKLVGTKPELNLRFIDVVPHPNWTLATSYQCRFRLDTKKGQFNPAHGKKINEDCLIF